MPNVLREYIEDGKQIIEYTKDGETVSHKMVAVAPDGTPPQFEQTPSVADQILAETQYQTALMEMNMMGGM